MNIIFISDAPEIRGTSKQHKRPADICPEQPRKKICKVNIKNVYLSQKAFFLLPISPGLNNLEQNQKVG